MKSPQVRILPIATLLLDDHNANKGTKRGRATLESSLRRLGAGRSVLIDKNNRIIAGNKTIEAAVKLGKKNVAVIQMDEDTLVAVQRGDLDLQKDKRAKELAVADNRVAELGLDWDLDALKGLDLDLGELWNEAELRKLGLAGDQVEAPEAQMDAADLLQKKWKTARGQIWNVGKHRIICGDSASDDVQLLMRKDRAECMWTDPPYGVSYVGKTKDKLTIENDGAAGLAQLLEKSFAQADQALQPGAAIYVAHPAGPLQVEFTKAFADVGWRIHEGLVWVKDSMVMGHSDYHYRHEPILFGYKAGEGRRGRGGKGWYGGHSETTVFEIDRPKSSEKHPTMKPVALVARMVANSCVKGGLVYEPFLGSGSTAVAAEQSGRVARCCEIEPKYVAVALERLADMGLKPRLARS